MFGHGPGGVDLGMPSVTPVLCCFSPGVDQRPRCSLTYLSQTQGKTARAGSLDAKMGGFLALHFFFVFEKKSIPDLFGQ